MGLAKIREDNKRKNFVNSKVNYSMLSAKDVGFIRKNVFKQFIEPLSKNLLEKKE